MGRHNRNHSKAMRAAVVYAVEEMGLTPKQVVALAAAGELKAAGGRNRLEAFEIADSTVKHYIYLARRRDCRATSNGGMEHEHEHEQPPDGGVPPRQDDPEPEPSSFMRMLMHGEERDQAIAEGRVCACPDPEPSEYDYARAFNGTDRRVCHGCFAPIAGNRHSAL